MRSENLKRVSRGSEILLSLATKDRCLSRLPIHELIARASLLYKRLLYGFHSCGERLYKWSFVRRERMTSPSLPSEKTKCSVKGVCPSPVLYCDMKRVFTVSLYHCIDCLIDLNLLGGSWVDALIIDYVDKRNLNDLYTCQSLYLSLHRKSQFTVLPLADVDEQIFLKPRF